MIMAFRNFKNRRGTPREVYTDNGTNFKGARNLLREMGVVINPDELRSAFDQIKWTFNCPLASHMGGVWERQIRTVKKCLSYLNPYEKTNDECLRCYLIEAEGIINSRPLTYVPQDPNEETALTPNHFLIGSSNGLKSYPATKSVDLRKNWKTAQRAADSFWHRYVKEYLPDLTRRTKWYSKTKPLEFGDIVIIFDDMHRNSWERGIVTEVIKGRRDDQVRQVRVKTSSGEYLRPATKVALLDVKKE